MSILEKYAKIASYINDNPIATLGTIGEEGAPHGAAIYVYADQEKHAVYFLTKNQTQKYIDIQSNERVSLTIVNPRQNSTVQATGKAFTVHDSQALDAVTKQMVRANALASEWIPPVSKLEAGQYVVVGVNLTHARLGEYKGLDIGSEDIFTEI